MIVLCTGCRSGFGLSIAVSAARAGHTVYAGLRDLSTGDRLAEATRGLDVRPIQLDVVDPEERRAAVDRVLDEHGRIDALINNAGVPLGGFQEQIEEDELRRLFEVNVFAAWALTKLCLPSMRERREGIVVNITSMAGRQAMPGLGAYAGSKFALEGMTEALRHEMRPFGVRVVLVEPGPYKTDIFARNRVVARAAEGGRRPLRRHAAPPRGAGREDGGAHGRSAGGRRSRAAPARRSSTAPAIPARPRRARARAGAVALAVHRHRGGAQADRRLLMATRSNRAPLAWIALALALGAALLACCSGASLSPRTSREAGGDAPEGGGHGGRAARGSGRARRRLRARRSRRRPPPRRRYVVAAIGDSLTDSRSPRGGRYLAYLRERCPESRFENFGRGGDMVNQMRRRFVSDVLPRARQLTHILVFGGVNDLSDVSAGRTVEDIEGDLSFMYEAARERGLGVIALTVAPWGGFTRRYSERRGAATRELNDWIRAAPARGAVDHVVDAYAVLSCGDPERLCPEYAHPVPDGLHFGPRGHEVLGEALHREVFADCL
ncbi:MAG: SDR family NAD(P)-dependent oxidoreductase [Sandaracinaceae bacterium]|nr:SDR family NAD(P)-dependent oxidoreductase [Sandaracinaceae bacterium]